MRRPCQSGRVILCEDGSVGNSLRGVTAEGHIFDLAKKVIAGQENEEFAGSAFSPTRGTLFVNLQTAQGLSFANWGPWKRGPFA